MMELDSEFIEQVSQALDCEVIQLKLDQQWGSSIFNSKVLLKSYLENWRLHNPAMTRWSVSHTLDLGGFAAIDGQGLKQIGFDIEIIDRIQSKVVRRVCQKDSEFDSAPSAAALWAAKEACFKSLAGTRQPLVLSQIETHSWQVKSHFETFQIENLASFGFSNGRGCTFKTGPHIFSFFIAST